MIDDPSDEPVAPPLPSDFFDFDLQKETISREELKVLLYKEIMSFNVRLHISSTALLGRC